jgi:hypothetical protein
LIILCTGSVTINGILSANGGFGVNGLTYSNGGNGRIRVDYNGALHGIGLSNPAIGASLPINNLSLNTSQSNATCIRFLF